MKKTGVRKDARNDFLEEKGGSRGENPFLFQKEGVFPPGVPPPHTYFLKCPSAFFSSRDTCACEMPISPATSICVRPS